MSSIFTEKQITGTVNSDGESTGEFNIVEKTKTIERCAEPDYIKIYTNMWCEFNEVPTAYRSLFLQLAARMSYANTQDNWGGQIVATGGITCEEICASLKIKRDMYQKGLAALCKCGAIKQVQRGWYQINPSYAGKGKWKYDPRLNSGGIEDLVSTFSFKDHKVNTEIIWADDGTEVTKDFREHVGMGAVLKNVEFTSKDAVQ